MAIATKQSTTVHFRYSLGSARPTKSKDPNKQKSSWNLQPALILVTLARSVLRCNKQLSGKNGVTRLSPGVSTTASRTLREALRGAELYPWRRGSGSEAVMRLMRNVLTAVQRGVQSSVVALVVGERNRPRTLTNLSFKGFRAFSRWWPGDCFSGREW